MTGRLRRLRTRLAVAVSPFTIGMGTAGPALADTAGGVGAAAGVAWLQVTDSDNVPVQAYALSLNRGGPLDPGPAVDSKIANWLYSMFKAIIDLALWLLDNVLSFSWLRVVSEPLNYVGTKMTQFALSPAVIGALGTIAAVIIGVGVVRGFLSRAGAQIGTALVLALMAVTLAGKQVAQVVGPNGLLALGRDIAFEFSTLFSPGGPRSGSQAVASATTELADHFARTPTQLWNFGRSLDQLSPACGQAWSAAIATGPLNEVKDAVRQACPGGEALYDYAMNTAASDSSTGFWAILLAVVVLIVFGYLCCHVVILGLSTLFWAIVTIFAAVLGFVPGPAQALAVKAVFDALLSWLGMMAYVVAVCITGSLAAAIFAASGDQVTALPLTALLLAALLVGLRKVNKKLSEWRESASEKAVRIGSKPGPTVPADLAALASEMSRPAYRPGTQIGRLDPLTAVPAAGQHARRIVKTGFSKVKTATVTGANPAAGAALHAASAAKGAASRSGAIKPKPPAAGSGGPRGAAPTGPGAPTAVLTRPPAATSARRSRAAAASSLAAPGGAPAQPAPSGAAAPADTRKGSQSAPPRPTSPKPARQRQASAGQSNAAAQLTAVPAPPPSSAAPTGSAPPAAASRRDHSAGSSAAPRQTAAPVEQRPAGSIHPALREAMRDAAADPSPPDGQP